MVRGHRKKTKANCDRITVAATHCVLVPRPSSKYTCEVSYLCHQRLQCYHANEILLTQQNILTYIHWLTFWQLLIWYTTVCQQNHFLVCCHTHTHAHTHTHTQTNTLKTTPALVVAEPVRYRHKFCTRTVCRDGCALQIDCTLAIGDI